MVKAENWGLDVMKKSGADQAWLQECMVPHWVRGGTDFAQANFTVPATKTKNMIPQQKGLDIIALGNSIGSGSKGINAPVLLVNSLRNWKQRKIW